MNILNSKNKEVIKAIKFCLNWHSQTMKLYGIDYKVDKEIYKCRVLDEVFGGRVTVRLEEKFVRSAINWLKSGGKYWNKI